MKALIAVLFVCGSVWAQDWTLIWQEDSVGCYGSNVEFTSPQSGLLADCEQPFRVTHNGGFSWDQETRWPFQDPPTRIVFFDSLQGIATLTHYQYALTFDGGATWQLRSTDDVPIGKPIYLDSERLITTVAFSLGGFGSVLTVSVSLDGGFSWFNTYYDYDELNGDSFYNLCYSSSEKLLGTSYNNGLVSSTDLGQTWEPIEGLPSFRPYVLASPSAGVFIVSGTTGEYPNEVAYLSRSDDDGLTWETVWTDASLHYPFYDACFFDPLHGWAAVYNGLVLSTSDGGATWSADTLPLIPYSYINSINFVDSTHGWILVFQQNFYPGHFERTLSLYAYRDAQNDAPREEILPTSFSLSTFPNPFNSSVTIEYEIAKAGEIELAVFNTLGQKVETLLDGNELAGKHSLSWSPNTTSGVYFVKLQSNGMEQSRKILYLR